MKVILRDFLEILINLWVSFSEAVEDVLELLKNSLGSDSFYVLMGDEEEATEIPVSRLGEFILDDGKPEETESRYEILSYPLTDALDFDKKPSEVELKGIVSGDKVLLVSNGESFWAIVMTVSNGDFEGVVDSTPQNNGYKQGQAIEFADHHIFQILSTAQAV